MTELPAFVWIAQMVATIGFGGGICAALYLGTRASGASPRRAGALPVAAGALFAALVAFSGYLAGAGMYRQLDEQVPWLGIVSVAVLVATLLAARVPAVAMALTDRKAAARLTLIHTFRVVGVVFLILMFTGRLPAVFALPAGLGDIAIAVAAPFVARRLATGDRRGAVAFNVLGILDLVIAITIGVLTAPGPLRLLDITPSTEPMSQLPLALIPTVLVPMYVGLHILSLQRLPGHRRHRVAPQAVVR